MFVVFMTDTTFKIAPNIYCFRMEIKPFTKKKNVAKTQTLTRCLPAPSIPIPLFIKPNTQLYNKNCLYSQRQYKVTGQGQDH